MGCFYQFSLRIGIYYNQIDLPNFYEDKSLERIHIPYSFHLYCIRSENCVCREPAGSRKIHDKQ